MKKWEFKVTKKDEEGAYFNICYIATLSEKYETAIHQALLIVEELEKEDPERFNGARLQILKIYEQ